MSDEVPKRLMSVLRRHRILAEDVRRVIGHLKVHKKVQPNDLIKRPRLKKKRGAPPEEEVPWVRGTELAGSWQQKDLKPGPNNKNVLYTTENGTWKMVVPEEDIETFLRRSMLDPKSTMPLSRDSAYHHVQKETVGISRRALYKFLEKQGVLQISRNIPDEQKKGGIMLEKRGYCEMDLIEGKGRDLPGFRGDWYWLAIVDVLTGFGLVRSIRRKLPKVVAPALEELLNLLEFEMDAKVYKISADHGREFYTDVRKLLKKRHIAMRQVPRGSRIEKFNQDFQRNFYRLLRLRRGNFSSLEDQAMEITNNTKNKYSKKTAKESLKIPDAVLVPMYNKRPGREVFQKVHGREAKVGDKCRYLIKLRKNIRPILKIGKHSRLYKTYHGRHFTKSVHTITEIITLSKKAQAAEAAAAEAEGEDQAPARRRFFVNGAWRNRDQLLLISGVDAETDRQVAARPKKLN